MEDQEAWKRLCTLLDDDELLWPGVREALEEDGDPWEALLSGLDDAGALAYLDAEDTGMELADALAQLPRVFRLQPDLGRVTDTDDLAEAMAVADEILAAKGFRLVMLDDEEDEDASSLVVVPAGSLDDVVAAAESVDRTITTFG
ncbi:hypothetical protein [Naasia sp. SYSU D00057]|uniref:DUF6630 family protein n=1 Tax=Naasia sp. SYSU D00057 TaxID=2817380 RepID=UPI001B3141F9|nr:hypothetical protein [Naasia sp. SYSU D00057]